jgi:hypothetical protein
LETCPVLKVIEKVSRPKGPSAKSRLEKPHFLRENEASGGSRFKKTKKPHKNGLLSFGKSRQLAKNAEKTRFFGMLSF